MGSKLNEQQQKAVNARQSKILVSASAGTGKTTVLVDRVLSLLKEKEDAIDINQLLILTFTRNAADHMRDKLEERISKDPDLDEIKKKRQLALLEEADITTISAYAEKIVKDYYYKLNIDPEFNILSEDVAKKSLRSEVWDDIITDIYHDNAENPMTAGVKNLLYLLTDGPKDSKLKNSVFSLYDFLASLKDPQNWKKTQRQNAKLPFGESEYFKQIATTLKDKREQFAQVAKLAAEYQSRYDYYQNYLAANHLEITKEFKSAQNNNLAYLKAIGPYLAALNSGNNISWENIKAVFKNSNFDENLKLEKIKSGSYEGIPNIIDAKKLEDYIECINHLEKASKNFQTAIKENNNADLDEVYKLINKYPDYFERDKFLNLKNGYNTLAKKITAYYDEFKTEGVADKIEKINTNSKWFDKITPFVENITILKNNKFYITNFDFKKLAIGKPVIAKSLILDEKKCSRIDEAITPSLLEEIKNATEDLYNKINLLSSFFTFKKSKDYISIDNISNIIESIKKELQSVEKYEEIYSKIEKSDFTNTKFKKNKEWFSKLIEIIKFFDELGQNKSLTPLVNAIYSVVSIGKSYTVKKQDTTDYVLDISTKILKNYGPLLGELIKRLPVNIEDQYHQQQTMIPAFLDLFELFTKAYDTRKDEVALYEFTDIERKALNLIANDEAIRQELNNSYKEIIIDEYQDTNELQETILEQIAGDNTRRFMVGDVKQSIYRFRHADHTLFMDKEAKFNSEQTSDATVIRLNTNYRSRKGVTEPINDIFSVIMNGENQELSYQEQALDAGNINYNSYHDDSEMEPEFDNSLEPFKFYKLALKKDDDKYASEAAFVVNKIKTIIAGKKQIIDRNTGNPRTVKPSDIAIITRSWNKNDVYLNELKKAGISYRVARSDLFLDQFEIHVALAYLRILDNNRQDISLVAVLHSPIYRISDQELAFLRVLQKSGSFYGTLFNFMTAYEDDKKALVKKATDLDVSSKTIELLHDKITLFLSDYNKLAALYTVSSLTDTMQAILSLTDIIPAFNALPNGQARRFNLNGLVQYISTFEGSGIVTVDNLVKSLENEKLTSINPNIDNTSLTYTTIHSSKGLEYPIVFIVNVENTFNNRDSSGNVIRNKNDLKISSINKEILDEDLDIFSLKNESKLLESLKEKLKQENISEEKRLLYVAMTRAEQALYLVASSNTKDPKKALDKEDGKNYLSMLNKGLNDNYIEYIDFVPKKEDPDDNGSEIFMKSDFSLPVEKETSEVINTHYATTDKELKGNIKNHEFTKEERLKSSTYHGQDYNHEIASANVQADILGTAAHLVFEKHLDKKHYPSFDVRNTIKQLKTESLITEQAASELLTNFVDGIQAFFDNGKGADMLKLPPSKVHPEFEFTAFVKTQETFGTLDEDYTIVHGFIDCFYEIDDEHVIIVDYKTDIRLTDDKVLSENYDGQLRLYTQALQAMGKKVKAAYVYGIRNQDLFEINIDDLK